MDPSTISYNPVENTTGCYPAHTLVVSPNMWIYSMYINTYVNVVNGVLSSNNNQSL